MIVVSLFVLLCIVWIVFSVLKNRKFFRMCVMIYRDPWNIPGVGAANVWLRGKGEERMQLFERFGRIAIEKGGMAGLWIGFRFFLMVADAAVAEAVYKTCVSKGHALNVSQEFLGNGTFSAPVHIWRPRRKIIAPTFNMKNLNKFVEVFDKQSKILVKQLKSKAGNGPFSISKYFGVYSLDSICETTIGVDVNAQQQPHHPFLLALDTFLPWATKRMFHPPIAQEIYKYLPMYKNFQDVMKVMWDFVDNVVTNKKQELLANDKMKHHDDSNKEDTVLKGKTFLEMLINTTNFTNLELREEALVLIVAGTDTTAVGLGYICLMLARYPDVQEKLHQEIIDELGDNEVPITSNCLPKLKYVEAVIKETLRLFPSAPMTIREVHEDIKLPSGMTIVKGTDVMINLWAVHRNPRYWGDDAEQFRPERHIGTTLTHPAAYIPFAYGARSCVGYQYGMLSMKTVLANLLRHYRILPASTAHVKDEPIQSTYGILMRDVNDFKVRLELRNND